MDNSYKKPQKMEVKAQEIYAAQTNKKGIVLIN